MIKHIEETDDAMPVATVKLRVVNVMVAGGGVFVLNLSDAHEPADLAWLICRRMVGVKEEDLWITDPLGNCFYPARHVETWKRQWDRAAAFHVRLRDR